MFPHSPGDGGSWSRLQCCFMAHCIFSWLKTSVSERQRIAPQPRALGIGQGPAPSCAGWVQEQAAAPKPSKPLLRRERRTTGHPSGLVLGLKGALAVHYELHPVYIKYMYVPNRSSTTRASRGQVVVVGRGSGAVGSKGAAAPLGAPVLGALVERVHSNVT